MLRKKLKENNKQDNHRNNKWGKENQSFPRFFSHFYVTTNTVDFVLMRYRAYRDKGVGSRRMYLISQKIAAKEIVILVDLNQKYLDITSGN